jgi:putative Holliday junction resolvase
MRLLGIDYGSKKIGLALSNSEGDFAAPHSVIPAGKNAVEAIKKIISAQEVGEIVMGRSLNFKREENEIMKEITPFAELLGKETGLPVHFIDETLTSAAARRTQEADAMLDARAAALLLESFIAKRKHG